MHEIRIEAFDGIFTQDIVISISFLEFLQGLVPVPVRIFRRIGSAGVISNSLLFCFRFCTGIDFASLFSVLVVCLSYTVLFFVLFVLFPAIA